MKKKVGEALQQFAVKEKQEKVKDNYNVEIYNGKALLGVVTVMAESYEKASTEAFKGINVKIRRSYN